MCVCVCVCMCLINDQNSCSLCILLSLASHVGFSLGV